MIFAVTADKIVDTSGAFGVGTDAAVGSGMTQIVNRLGTVDGDTTVEKRTPGHGGVEVFFGVMYRLEGVGFEDTAWGTMPGFARGGFECVELLKISIDVNALCRFVHNDLQACFSRGEECFGFEKKFAAVFGQ